MNTCSHDDQRRKLVFAVSAIGGLGAAAAVVPFAASLLPSQRAKSAGAPVEVDIGKLQPGQMITVEWRGKPVWIVHRTPEMLAGLESLSSRLTDPESARPMQPEDCRNTQRSIKPEILVAVGICTHLGCSPNEKFKPGPESAIDADWLGGFFCPCHGSTFDLAGRVFRNKPAPDNLEIPPHRYLSATRLIIGDDTQA
ncbi:ubiquinol-cytochrome c reductase iron-sulfur subunit [Sulfuritalea sp.]|uniref:ubiquinol-cytochrome c reductase iron-sulfur subunit n=1 Tax=Sulfuritalea sp. TaxID=2480090 RepID=UPI00286DF7F8|nr:ubiquinol-cytochrome c reductase iron-sulfur subunit [Sulfuritalea sp.]